MMIRLLVLVLLVPLSALAEVAPSPRKISYTRDIRPIFEQSCAKCHLNGNRKGGLRLDTRELILKGGEDGAVVEPHKSDDSSMIELLTADDPETRMPKKGAALSQEKIDLIRAWIDQGLPWDAALAS